MRDLNTLAKVNVCQLTSSSPTHRLFDFKVADILPYKLICLSDCYTKEELLYFTQLCDENHIYYMLSGGYYLHGWFTLCLGADYAYCLDAASDKTKTVKHAQYATYTDILSVQYNQLLNRFNSTVSKTYIRSVLLLEYQSVIGKSSADADAGGKLMQCDAIETYVREHLSSQGLQSDYFTPQDIQDVHRYLELRVVQGVDVTNIIMVSSILGSCMSNEVIKILSKAGEPINDVFIYDGITLEGKAYNVSAVWLASKHKQQGQQQEKEKELVRTEVGVEGLVSNKRMRVDDLEVL